MGGGGGGWAGAGGGEVACKGCYANVLLTAAFSINIGPRTNHGWDPHKGKRDVEFTF